MKRIRIYILLLMTLTVVGCANRGVGPQGGPKDTTPPKPLQSEPEIGALNFTGNRIEVTFDEYIQLDNVVGNLLMSPPQQNPPEVKARGKRLIVNFVDELHDSTTYTIDFGNAVCDYREKVPLHGYSFYFSTGDEIDTLEYTGRVYEAATLNPMQGILVGIHRNMDDSAFTRLPFLRIAKTDSVGRFRIGNIHPGNYRLYAVDDISRDYRLTPGEACGYADQTIEIGLAEDSTSDGSLLVFKEEQQKLYLQKVQRSQQHCIQMLFSAPSDSAPELKPLCDTLHYYTHFSARYDTVTLWLLDSVSIKQDSLMVEVRSRRTDSLYHLEWCTDTVRAFWRAPKLNAKAQELQDRINRNRRLEIKTNARKEFEIYDTLRLTCSTPLASIAMDSLHIFERIDTVTQEVPFSIAPHDSVTQELVFIADLKPGGNYELRLDSGALHDVYGITHIAGTYGLLVKQVTDYSTLKVKLNPYLPNARIQLLNNKDQVIRELPADENGTLFEYLKADTYYMRLYLDLNEDGKWTTGSWEHKQQPEPIYYFPQKIQTKSNWDFEEEWDYQAVEQLQAKPRELIKVWKKK